MIREALREWLSQEGGKLEERGESLVFAKILGERRVFLARRKILLRVELQPDEGKKELVVKLALEERGFGLPQETGFGSRLERYKVGKKREGTVAEELAFFCLAFWVLLRLHRVPAGTGKDRPKLRIRHALRALEFFGRSPWA